MRSGWMPSVSAGVVEEVAGDQLVLYDSRGDRVHILNLAAAAVFDLCDGRTTVAGIIAAMEAAAPPGSFDCACEVPKILSELLEKGLLE
jgi:molybdopterin-guanine dinucleotide biosynthesis protein A